MSKIIGNDGGYDATADAIGAAFPSADLALSREPVFTCERRLLGYEGCGWVTRRYSRRPDVDFAATDAEATAELADQEFDAG